MPEQERLTFLCVACALVGRPFMLEAKRLGHEVLVMTQAKRLDLAWPRDQVDEVFGLPDMFDEKMVRNVVSYMGRTRKIDRIVPMGDPDVEVASALREHLRVPGMGETTARYFRDKLAMRMRAKEAGIRIPEFVPVFHHPDVEAFMDAVPAPWVLKPRMEVGSMGITKLHSKQEAWEAIEALGDKQSMHLLERFVPGDLYHVDSIVSEKETVFASVQRYGIPMLALNREGGIYTTRTVRRNTGDERALKKLNLEVIKQLGLVRGVTHIEYIKSAADGQFYFLEAGARVGAAKIADVVYEATGVCLWHEWVKIEAAQGKQPYEKPKPRKDYAGVIVTLARQEYPDMSTFDDPEVVWRSNKKNHAGLVIRSSDPDRVEELLNRYAERFSQEFMAHAPRATV